MNYTAILKRAAEITWRHRALWLFGVLLALFGGSSGGSGGGGGGAGPSLQYQFGHGDLAGLQMPPEVSVALVPFILLAALVFILVMIALAVVVGYTARGALIGMVDEVERTGATSLSSGFRTGWARFLRLFAIALVIGLPATIALMVLLIVLVAPPVGVIVFGVGQDMPALAVLAGLAAVGLFLLWLVLAIVVGAVIEVLSEVMYRRAVLDLDDVFQSVREGYRVVRSNLREVGLTWLILFGIRLALNIVLMPVAILAFGLVAMPGFAAWALTGSAVAALVAALPLLLVIGAALVLAQGIYLVFHSAVWTLVYREITSGGAEVNEAIDAPTPEGEEDGDDGAPEDEPSGEQ